MKYRNIIGAALFALCIGSTAALAGPPVVGEITTTWNNTFKPGAKSDQIIIERFDDPKVKNVSCYVSRAVTGGYLALVGAAEDPSRFSIACRSTGKVEVGNIDKTKTGEKVFSESASFIFKTVNITRHFDAEKNVLLYTVWSAKLIDGSPSNAITAVPVQ